MLIQVIYLLFYVKNDIIAVGMGKKLLLICFMYWGALVAQEKPGPFLQRILSHKSPVLIFNFQSSTNEMPIHKILDLTPTFTFSGQAITKSSKGLFLNHLGTGRIYQWKGDEASGQWTRIDSTYFTGYNFLSLFFSMDSTIYSFGGTGYWYNNGNLRKYNPIAKEWNVKRLDNSIPWIYETDELFYIDTSNRKLYFNGQGRKFDAGLADASVDSSSINKLYCIDIDKGTFKELGSYEPSMTGFFGQTPWGTIVSFDKLADYSNNKYYKLSEKIETQLFKILSSSNSSSFIKQYSFWIDSVLYFTKTDLKYDSIIIHRSDLTPTNIPVYFPSTNQELRKSTTSIPWLWIISTAMLISLNIYLYKRRNKKHSTAIANNNEGSELFIQEKFKLTEVELNLLQTIFENSILKKTTSIDSINTILGCTNKSIEVQKRLRSDTINTINQKISMSVLIDYNIIQRKRSEFDGRSFEYFIEEQNLHQVRKFLA